MVKIDSGYDETLGSNYELCKTNLYDLKVLVTTWYKGTDFKEFDKRLEWHSLDYKDKELAEMKKAGLTSNYFFVYKEGDEYYLMDGFNRLLTSYAEINFNPPVYVKVLTSKLTDHDLMKIMFHLNMWKLQGDGHYNFKPDDFFDRGFRLMLFKKFGIKLYSYKDWSTRTQNRKDFDILFKYFRNEREFSDAFAFKLSELRLLMGSERIVDDIKELIKSNIYLEPPFKNYEMFFDGFAMFLSRKRVNGDMSEYKFETYLEKLKADTKFFKKLQGMSGTDSTRKNIFEFFESTK